MHWEEADASSLVSSYRTKEKHAFVWPNLYFSSSSSLTSRMTLAAAFSSSAAAAGLEAKIQYLTSEEKESK